MSLQPYTLAFHHALELDDFLEEADITTTDLFAVLGNERYRKSLKNDIKTIVDEYKEQGRDPPPVNFIPTTKPSQGRLRSPAKPLALARSVPSPGHQPRGVR